MKYLLSLLVFLSYSSIIAQNNVLKYALNHNEKTKNVTVTIEFDSINTAKQYLQIPRSAPGTYDITDYPSFIENIQAVTLNDSVIKGQRGLGSILFFKHDAIVNTISYDVNIIKMEAELKGGYASSKIRENYLGILGYSVFATIPGFEDKPIELTISSDANWPVFTTLQPSVTTINTLTLPISNYATLVDAQYLLGSDVQVFQVEDAEIPLFVAVYAETEINIQEIGRRGLLSLQGLSNYFGNVPMPHYTLCYEFIKPFSDTHSYGFSMEHINSMTASLTIASAITEYDAEASIFGVVHHMGHSWIPLRSYGKGYRPFDWGSAPIIETIWLNEGFIWYVTTIITDSPNTINFFKRVTTNAPSYIKHKSLKELSQLGSSQYSGDFNIGRNLFSRGALMAYEMDNEIKQLTNNEKTFKDALLGLLNWTKVNNRAFEYSEIEPILSKSTGVDLSDIWLKWQNE
jgi:predicted metalloprotease with PDZ domain